MPYHISNLTIRFEGSLQMRVPNVEAAVCHPQHVEQQFWAPQLAVLMQGILLSWYIYYSLATQWYLSLTHGAKTSFDLFLFSLYYLRLVLMPLRYEPN